MTDRFKFRVWDGEQMILPDKVDRDGLACSNSIPEFSDKIMQCTGLKDKNGKLIFEGDVIKISPMKTTNLESTTGFPSPCPVLTKGHVVWVPETARFLIDHSLFCKRTDEFTAFNCFDLKIIGNIYENPELLEEEK